jgi:ATP-dependent DNA helicase RecG
MSTDPLRKNVHELGGVTPTRREQLGRLGIETVRDLLFHIPRAYQDLTDVRPVAALAAGTLQTVHGEVVEIGGRHLPDGRNLVSIVISDGRDCLEGVWFNQVYMAGRFRYGQQVAFSGKPKRYRDHWQMTNPRVTALPSGGEAVARGKGQRSTPPAPEAPGVVPVYPLTEDLRPGDLRALIRRAVEGYARHVAEILHEGLRRRRALPEITDALRDLHFPVSMEAARAARRRFVYEEFLVLQVALAVRRREMRDRLRAPILQVTPQIDARIRRLFPFRLTADQDQAVAAVCRDLAGGRPMQRLLQADVGAGKTAVAVYALLVAVANKQQAVLLAPTEVLVRQHWRTLEGYLAHSRVRRLRLTGGLSARERRAALEEVRTGAVDLVVGTQALLQEDVRFARLGLVVIDEQHKFGVNQRARVRRLGIDPHYLVMTATPIPRSLALTVFGDLDTSVIRQLPPGRRPVVTRCVASVQRERVYQRLRDGLRDGRQAYVVCPLVAETERSDLKAAVQTHAELRDGPLGDFRVGLLHGGMAEADKDRVMEAFRRRELDVLVSTSVIEVGVDVPNATLLVVEHGERFGLSQLHQIRGRVSRGSVAGLCYVLADPVTEEARQRLRALTRTTDGFALAEHDLRLRGVGELFGTRQHGLGDLRFGDLLADADLLRLARQDAFALAADDVGLRRPEHALLRRTVLDRYGRTLDLPEAG